MATISQSGGNISISYVKAQVWIVVRFEGTINKRVGYVDQIEGLPPSMGQWTSCVQDSVEQDVLPPNLDQCLRFNSQGNVSRVITLKPRFRIGDCSVVGDYQPFSLLQEALHVDALPKQSLMGDPKYQISQWLVTITGQPAERAIITIVLQDDDLGGGGF